MKPKTKNVCVSRLCRHCSGHRSFKSASNLLQSYQRDSIEMSTGNFLGLSVNLLASVVVFLGHSVIRGREGLDLGAG